MYKTDSMNKNEKTIDVNNRFTVKFFYHMFFFIFLITFFMFIYISSVHVASGFSFVPNPPSGTTVGDINVEYEYKVYTIEVGSSWMFDWGDGNYSGWIKVENSKGFISQNHSWSDYGVYKVRVKYRSVYMVESPWSDPLTVNITLPSDLDGDGWINEVEIAYGKNPNDPNEYPLDTDNDGTPDNNSIDGRYTGDVDDDGDGLTDSIEESIGSNPKDNSDVETVFVENTIFYIVDTDNDNQWNILYNPGTGLKTKITNQNGVFYLDINGDGNYDYTYNNGLFVYRPFPWLQVILAAAGIILIIIAILFKTGIIYLYEEEYIVEE